MVLLHFFWSGFLIKKSFIQPGVYIYHNKHETMLHQTKQPKFDLKIIKIQ